MHAYAVEPVSNQTRRALDAVMRWRFSQSRESVSMTVTVAFDGTDRSSYATVVIASWMLADGVPAAADSPPPPLRLLFDNNAALDLPPTFGIPSSEVMNAAGDYVFIAGGGTAVFLRRAGDSTLTRLLQWGDELPDITAGRCESISATNLSWSGPLVVLRADYMDGGATKDALLLYDLDTGELSKLVASSDIAPDTGGSVYGRGLRIVGTNDNGDVAFAAPLRPLGTPMSLPDRNTIFMAPADSGEIVRVVGWGDSVPERAATFDQISPLGLNNNGEILFRASIVGDTGGNGYFVATTTGVRKVVATGDPARIGTFGPAMSASGVRMNQNGQVVFANNNAVYVSDPDTGLTLLFEPGDPLPEPLEEGTVTGLTLWSTGFADTGEIAFTVFLDGIYDVGTAVLRYTPGVPEGSLQVVAQRGQPAAGEYLGGFYNVSLNNDGDVSFYGVMKWPYTVPNGFFIKPAGEDEIVVPVHTLEAAPSPIGGTHVLNGSAGLRPDGSLYFESEIAGGSAAYATFLWIPGSGTSALMTTADPIPAGSRVSFRNLFMGGAGHYTMFTARRTGGGNTLWVLDSQTGARTRIVADGDPVPGLEGARIAVTSSYNQWLTIDGHAAFPAWVFGRNGNGIFYWLPDSGIHLLAGPGSHEAASDFYFATCTTPSLLARPFNDNRVVFRGTTPDGRTGLFVTNGDSMSKIAVSGESAPGGGTFVQNSMSYYYINGPGQVAFLSGTTGTSSTAGIFIGGKDIDPVKVVALGDAAPGGGTFAAFTTAGPADSTTSARCSSSRRWKTARAGCSSARRTAPSSRWRRVAARPRAAACTRSTRPRRTPAPTGAATSSSRRRSPAGTPTPGSSCAAPTRAPSKRLRSRATRRPAPRGPLPPSRRPSTTSRVRRRR